MHLVASVVRLYFHVGVEIRLCPAVSGSYGVQNNAFQAVLAILGYSILQAPLDSILSGNVEGL